MTRLPETASSKLTRLRKSALGHPAVLVFVKCPVSWNRTPTRAASAISPRCLVTEGALAILVALGTAGCGTPSGRQSTAHEEPATEIPLATLAPGTPISADMDQAEVLAHLDAQIEYEHPGMALQSVVAKGMTFADYFERINRDGSDGRTVDHLMSDDRAESARDTDVWAVGFKSADEIWRMSWYIRAPAIMAMEDARPNKYRGPDGLAVGCMAIDRRTGRVLAATLAPSGWYASECYDRLASYIPRQGVADPAR